MTPKRLLPHTLRNPDPLGKIFKAAATVEQQRLVRRREDFDRGVVNAAIEEALTALGKAKMKLPLNLAHELQHAHDHLLNARDWVEILTLNNLLSCPQDQDQ